MADEKRLPPPSLVLAGERYEREQMAREQAERDADPLDEAKREGGFFLTADSDDPVDAEGRKIEDGDLDDAESTALKEHRARRKAESPEAKRAAAAAKRRGGKK